MRTVLAAVLLLRGLSAFAFAVHPEIPITPTELVASRNMTDSHLASDGETYVAVWTDYRSFPGAVYAARFRADGTRLDSVGIRLAPDSQAGAVIWSGNAFLIAYLQEGTIKVRTLSPEGVLGEPIPLFTAYEPENGVRMRMATNGDSVLLITSATTAVLLELDGRKRRELELWRFPGNGFGVAAAGSNYLVAAGRHNLEVKTQIVTGEGELGQPHVLMDTVRFGIDVASDGERFLVTWARGNLYAQFIAGDGTPVEPLIRLSDVQPVVNNSHLLTRVIRRGNEYVLLYQTYGGAPFDTLRLGDDGGKRGSLLTNFDDPIGDIVATAAGGAILGGYPGQELSAAFFDTGAPTPLRDRTPVSLNGKHQSQVRLARLDDGIAVAWYAEASEPPELFLSRGPGSAPVSVVADYATLVDVVSDGTAIWVFWANDEAKVYVRRFTLALQPIDTEPVPVDDLYLTDFGIAAGGGAIVVVHNEPQGMNGLEPDGAHIGAHILRGMAAGIQVTKAAVASVDGYDRLPAIVWDGNAFLVAWANATAYYLPLISTNDRSSPYKPDDRILAVHLSLSGEVLDANPIEVARTKHVEALSLANTAVAWQTYATPDLSSRRHTYAARVAANATVADLGGEDTFFGAFAADRGGFLLTRARVLDATTLAPEVVAIDANLTVTSIDAVPPITVDLIQQDLNPFDADVLGGAVRIIGYSRIAADDYGHARRIFLRRLAETHRRRALR